MISNVKHVFEGIREYSGDTLLIYRELNKGSPELLEIIISTFDNFYKSFSNFAQFITFYTADAVEDDMAVSSK